ncbi:MAG: glutathione S-transferase family protein [Geminicoccaceae bacterium]
MFESGAILLHIASKSDVLAPSDAAGRARMASWVFAAVNSIEPIAQNVIELDDNHKDEPRAEDRRTLLVKRLLARLSALSDWLGEKSYLEERFTVGDLMMVCVLRELAAAGLLASFLALDAYRRRGETRPAFSQALEAQLKPFREHDPG